MRHGLTGKPVLRGALWIGLAGLLAGCASAPGGQASGGGLSGITAFFTPPPPPPITQADIKVDCPEVDVLDGTAAVRVYAGADQSNDSVRYQYSLGDLARECSVDNNQLAIKVGVTGRVLLGPAGAPGSFNVPVRIVVRRESDQQPIVSKLYQAAAAVPAGGTGAQFSIVSDPLVVPFTGQQADQDYSVLVGFDTATSKPTKPVRRKRK